MSGRDNFLGTQNGLKMHLYPLVQIFSLCVSFLFFYSIQRHSCEISTSLEQEDGYSSLGFRPIFPLDWHHLENIPILGSASADDHFEANSVKDIVSHCLGVE